MSMIKEKVLERLNPIFWDIFDDDSILVDETTTAEDIEAWDSLMHINLILVIEAEFGMKFSMQEIVASNNVGEIIDILVARATR